MKFTYLYNAGNDSRKAVGLILKDRAKSIGMEIDVQSLEWSSFLERLRLGDFDLFMHGSASPSLPQDFKSSYHSSSTDGGRNYVNYKSKEADSLIDLIRNTTDESKRNELYKSFQAQINQDIPIIFLLSPYEKFAYSNRLNTIKSSTVRPNYWAPSLLLK